MNMLFFRAGGEPLRGAETTSALERAIAWVKANRIPGSGIRPHDKSAVPTMEVTGYLIPTLRNAGEPELARDLARWEASVQAPDGSFAAPGEDVPYTFDTAQVIRGFLAMMDEVPGLEQNLRLACDFVASQIGPDGRVTTPSYDMWKLEDGSTFNEYANLYVLPPLLEAGKKLGEPAYVSAAERGVAYYKSKPDLAEFKPEIGTLSHIFGYMMEALVELGENGLARKGLGQAAAIQKENGAIPAFPGVEWVCSTGMAQLAVAWYKLGERGPADRAMDYLKTLQNESGGFYGSYGMGAKYLPSEEISWAVKYFIDAWLLRGRNVSGQGQRGTVTERTISSGLSNGSFVGSFPGRGSSPSLSMRRGHDGLSLEPHNDTVVKRAPGRDDPRQRRGVHTGRRVTPVDRDPTSLLRRGEPCSGPRQRPGRAFGSPRAKGSADDHGGLVRRESGVQ